MHTIHYQFLNSKTFFGFMREDAGLPASLAPVSSLDNYLYSVYASSSSSSSKSRLIRSILYNLNTKTYFRFVRKIGG